jgi:hypothetical protein
MNYQGINDPTLPSSPKPSLQQYDNYQIYDLFCTDKIMSISVNAEPPQQQIKKQQNFLAVQAFDPRYQIPVNFTFIATTYKGL